MQKKIALIVTSGMFVIFIFIGALMARAGAKDNSYAYLTIFSNVLHLIDGNYVESVDFNKLMDSAVYGMVESLDSDSFFLRGKDLEDYKKTVEETRSRAGVGITLCKRYGMITVLAVEKGSSADENKIKSGDYIRSINDQYVQDMPLYKIETLIKGNPGSQVKISFYESALEKPKDFTLTRKAISKPYIDNYVVQPKIGYIRVLHLLPGVENDIQNKLNSMNQQGVERLVLDLRGCTEEDQNLAVKVASLFIGSAPIGQINGREGTIQKLNGSGKPAFKGNLLVLVDYTTAGSSEIIASAIQDSGLGKCFGTRTFGKGGIQKVIPAGENYVVLTTEKYVTPKGKMILSNGVEPEVPYKEEVKKADEPEDVDQMLNKAFDYLRYSEQKAA